MPKAKFHSTLGFSTLALRAIGTSDRKLYYSIHQWHLPALCRYIDNQEKHHKTTSFEDEYLNLLKKLKIDYEPEYLWKS